MTWTNLQLDILEDFTDPRWYGMHLNQFELPFGVETETDTVVTQLVTRKTPDDVREYVLEIANTRFIWFARDIAELTGDTTHGGSTQVGRILEKAGWRHVRSSKRNGEHKHHWVNDARVIAWFQTQPSIDLAYAQKHTGVAVRTLTKILREHGWTKSQKRKVQTMWSIA